MTVTQTPPAPPARSRRGRETALDMVRSLAVVLLLVVPLWFFGQGSPSDSQKIRPVDPTEALQAFGESTGGPVPTTPSGWVSNVREIRDGVVRVGYVVGDGYAEFQGAVGTAFLEDATGKGKQVGTVDVGGVTWQDWRSQDDHESLVRTVGKVTVLVGGVRENVTLDQLKALAATVR